MKRWPEIQLRSTAYCSSALLLSLSTSFLNNLLSFAKNISEDIWHIQSYMTQPVIQIYIYTCMCYTVCTCTDCKKYWWNASYLMCKLEYKSWIYFCAGRCLTYVCEIRVLLFLLEARHFFPEINMPTLTWVEQHNRRCDPLCSKILLALLHIKTPSCCISHF